MFKFQLLFDGSKGPANLPIISENIRRMVVLVFDYVNTLKPIADMNVEEKVRFAELWKYNYLKSHHRKEVSTFREMITHAELEKR